MAATTRSAGNAKRATGAKRSSSNGARPRTTSAKAKTPIVAGGAAVAGLAAGTALGAALQRSRRPRVLGVPTPRAKEMAAGARQALQAGRWFYDVQTDLRLLREHVEQSRRQSPIEVLLSGLTARALPRRR